MADDTIVRWEGSGPSGCLLPLSIVPFGVLLTSALNLLFSVPWSPHGLIILGSISVLGVVLWPLNDRNEVTAAEFTPLQMRLESRAAVRTVEVADLIEVTVAHSGDTDEGYTRTSLQVAWCDGKEVIDGLHDATLAPSLRRTLPPGVEIRHVWEELESLP